MAFKKATTVPNSTSTAEVLEEGMYNARIVQIIDIGQQAHVPNPKIKTPKDQFKFVLKFELSDEFMLNEDGTPNEQKPRWFDFEVAYTPDGYMHEKSILLKLWNAVGATEETELKDLIGRPIGVMLSKYIRKTGAKAGTEANKVSAVIKLKEKDAAKLPPLVNPTLFFDLAEPDLEIFNTLPSGNQYALKDKILANMNFAGSKLDCLIQGIEYVEQDDQESDQSDEPVSQASETVETPASTPATTVSESATTAPAVEDDPYA